LYKEFFGSFWTESKKEKGKRVKINNPPPLMHSGSIQHGGAFVSKLSLYLPLLSSRLIFARIPQ
jgi:hypothetical protein